MEAKRKEVLILMEFATSICGLSSQQKEVFNQKTRKISAMEEVITIINNYSIYIITPQLIDSHLMTGSIYLGWKDNKTI